jgi:tetratricopeptide (TPR) repeat protein
MRALAAILAAGLGTLGAVFGADLGTAAPDPAELNNRGVQWAAQKRYAEAEAAYRRALEGWALRAELPGTARNRAHTLENLGSLLRSTGRYAESEPLLTQALSGLEAAAGESSVDVGEALENLAALYRAKSDTERAERCALRAGALLPEPERTKNQVMLASIYIDERRFAAARAILETALPGATGQFGFTLNANLAAAALGERKLEDAERFARGALEIAAAAMPPGHVGLAAVWNNLWQTYRFQGRYLEAESSYLQAIEIWTAARGPAHPDVARGLLNLAAFDHERGREHAAEKLYGRAAAIFEQAGGTDDLQALVARNELAEVFRAEGRYVASAQLSRATLPALRRSLPESDPRVVRAVSNYARLLADTRRAAKAKAGQ